MRVIRGGGNGAEDHLDVVQRIGALVEGSARHLDGAQHAVVETEEGEEDGVVLGIAGIQRQVEQAGLGPTAMQRLKPGDGGGNLAIRTYHPQCAGQFFGDQEFAVGQEGQRPRGVKPAGDFGQVIGRGFVIGRAGLFGIERLVVDILVEAAVDRLSFLQRGIVGIVGHDRSDGGGRRCRGREGGVPAGRPFFLCPSRRKGRHESQARQRKCSIDSHGNSPLPARLLWHIAVRPSSHLSSQNDQKTRDGIAVLVIFVKHVFQRRNGKSISAGQARDISLAVLEASAFGQLLLRGDGKIRTSVLVGKEGEDEQPILAQA